MRSPNSPMSQNSKKQDAKKKWTKWITLVVCFLLIPGILCLLAWATPAIAETPKRYDELTFPPLPEIQIPDLKETKLKNGLTVYLLEDHELPLVGGQAWIKTGTRFDPKDKVGLASIVGEVIRTGGTQDHPADQLNQTLEQRAASVEVGISETSGNASFNALSEDLTEVFGLFAEVLRQPAFPEDKITLSKTQHMGAIQRRNDDPGDIGTREFKKVIYGDQSPYARLEEYESIRNISAQDIRTFYEDYFQPNRVILGIVGDFDSATMMKLVEAKLGDWQSLERKVSDDVPPASQTVQGGTYLVNQPQLTQSTVQIGHIGGQLKEPDVFPLYVMNEILNSFGGRLFNEVRSRLGLAYSVYGVWSPRYDYPGLFISGGQTRSEATVPFINAVKSEIQQLRQAPVSQTELDQAKDAILNSFVFNFEKPSQTLSRLMKYDYYGYPKDFIFKYQAGVKAATVNSVLDAAQRNLQPDKLVTLVVGSEKMIQPSLNTLDPNIQMIDATIPGSPSA